MCGASAVAIAYAAAQVKKDSAGTGIKTTAVAMGVTGAFVFAAQMLNFGIPAAGGVSGHIVGGILLAALLGAAPALLTMSAILAVQCLCFADGGLLALGCNIFNMGVIPCLLVYPAVFKPLADKYKGPGAAAAAASAVGLSAGAFAVTLEVLVSGVAGLPFSKFASLMLPVHFVIGVVEGLATAAILCLVQRTAFSAQRTARAALVSFAVAAIIIGGGLSRFASSHPDGLEWSVQKASAVDARE
jgi:cobalt/nickel transport system permease protein